MKKLYFVRHGQTPWNIERKVCGATDVPLTELGHQQAIETGQIIKDMGLEIDEIISSPLVRAKETAEHIGEAIGVPVRTDDRIIERNFGYWEGLNWDNDEFGADRQQMIMAFETGETQFRVAQRIYNFLDEIGQDDKTYIMVAHNGIARVVQSYFHEMTNEEFAFWGVKNCQVVEYVYE